MKKKISDEKSVGLRPTILPVSTNCNMRCSYCYCDHGQDGINKIMSYKMLEIIIKKFAETYPSFISFCWHGGEPLMAGLDFFQHVCKIQDKYQKESQVIENRIQTNGTLITEGVASFFNDKKFKIGISIDGPKYINDACRKMNNDTDSFEHIYVGINNMTLFPW